VKRTTSPTQDEVVTAVLSRASTVRRLATQFTAAVGDPLGEANFPEIASGGFVSLNDLRVIYEVYDELWPLQGRVSVRRMKALGTPNAGWLRTSRSLLKARAMSSLR
jgi:hypothetical protein